MHALLLSIQIFAGVLASSGTYQTLGSAPISPLVISLPNPDARAGVGSGLEIDAQARTLVGANNMHADAASGMLRYGTASGHFSIGLGEQLFTRRSDFNITNTVQEHDAVRAAGMRFEIGGTVPVWGGAQLRLTAGFAPSMRGAYSPWYSDPSFTYAGQTSERASLASFDAEIDRRRSARSTFAYGVHYVNYRAAFTNGGFAERVSVVQPFVAFGLNL